MELMMDCGAFSAWTKGHVVDLDAYIQFCHDNLDVIDNVVALDVIPGRPGYKDIPFEEREQAASQGYENYRYMVSKGLPRDRCIVVFHQGDHFHWLERLRDEKVPYIGLSPANDRTTSEKMAWLDECMYYATDRKGLPLMKWHGFAVTSVPLMKRYPWYSVDSATWVLFAAYGTIIVPKMHGDKILWLDDQPSYTKVSNAPKCRVDIAEGKHIHTYSDADKDAVLAYLSSIGVSLGESRFEEVPADTKPGKNQKWAAKAKNGTRLMETIIKRGVCNDLNIRMRCNALYFANIERSLPAWPWSFQSKPTLGLTRLSPKNELSCPFEGNGDPLRIYLAGNHRDRFVTHRFLAKHDLERSYRRLVSYAYMKEAVDDMEYKRGLNHED